MITSSSPKMLPKSRSDSDITRDMWLISSIGNMIGPSHHGAPGGAPKCSDVLDDALLADALVVVVDPDRQRAAERDVDAAGRRHQAGHQPHVVPEQDEDAEGRDERQEAVPFGPIHSSSRPSTARTHVLEHDLERAGLLDAQPGAHDQAQTPSAPARSACTITRNGGIGSCRRREMIAHRLAGPDHDRPEQRVDERARSRADVRASPFELVSRRQTRGAQLTIRPQPGPARSGLLRE